MTPSLTWVDAFAERPFGGNPAAVCVVDAPLPEAWMQALAAELGISETAFVAPDGAGGFGLRWFTPAVEVDLCGHATLASAHALWESGALAPGAPARFATRSGTLIATTDGERIALDFPAVPATEAEPPAGLAEALGAAPVRVARNALDDWLVELADEAAVRELAPDFAALANVPIHGVIATAPAAPPYDFVSRFFAPRLGIDEDPVTGSAHCALAPWWSGRLGRNPLVGFQASARGGVVGVEVRGDRVVLTGRARTVLRGALAERPEPESKEVR